MVTWYKFTFAVNVTLTSLFYTQWQTHRSDPPPPPTPLFLDQTEVRRAEKVVLETGPPLSQVLDDRPHPPFPPLMSRSGSGLFTPTGCADISLVQCGTIHRIGERITGQIPSLQKEKKMGEKFSILSQYKEIYY